MNANTTAAVLHMEEAARLLQGICPRLAAALLQAVDALVQTDPDRAAVRDMKSAAVRMAEGPDGPAD